MLDDAKCRNAKAGDRDRKFADQFGLYLFVSTKGSKSFRMKYRFAGKEKVLTLGRYPDVSLAAARRLRDAARLELHEGRDPGLEKKKRKEALVVSAGQTLEAVTRAWHENQKGRWASHHAWDVLHSLERDIFPSLGRVPIAEINAQLLLAALRRVENRGAVETAHRLRQRLEAIFDYAEAAEMVDRNPAEKLGKALKPKPSNRKQPAVIDLAAARKLLAEAEQQPASPITKLGHRFLALTAVRSGVLRAAPWDEFHGLQGQNPFWRIPAARMKLLKDKKLDDENDHIVPLAPQAVEVIEAVRTLTGRGPLVFPSSRHAHRPMSENTINAYLIRAGYYGRHVGHGWRASFSTIMNEEAERRGTLEHDIHILNRMLAHAPRDKVEAAYNRAAWLPRRRELAELWASLIMGEMPPADSVLNCARR